MEGIATRIAGWLATVVRLRTVGRQCAAENSNGMSVIVGTLSLCFTSLMPLQKAGLDSLRVDNRENSNVLSDGNRKRKTGHDNDLEASL